MQYEEKGRSHKKKKGRNVTRVGKEGEGGSPSHRQRPPKPSANIIETDSEVRVTVKSL